MPADSKARLSAATVELWAAKVPGADSSRLMVGSDTPEALARFRCSQRNSARAARISSLVMDSESNASGIYFEPLRVFINTSGIDTTIFVSRLLLHAFKSLWTHTRPHTSCSESEKEMRLHISTKPYESRRTFIGGSDARIILGSDEAGLIRLWREKRGEAEPEDLSGNLIVQLGTATEDLNRSWYERNSGRRVRDVQRRVKHSAIPWMAATLDGIVEGTEAVFEAKFMLPWSFSEEGAAEKYTAQVQHNMWVTNLRTSVLSIITGGGKWVEIAIPMDPLYLSVLVSAE